MANNVARERGQQLQGLRLYMALDAIVLKIQRKKIDGMYNRACDLRDAYPNGMISPEQYETVDTLYGKQYRTAWRRGLVRVFAKQTRIFRKRFKVKP